jgi:hypothetical protein
MSLEADQKKDSGPTKAFAGGPPNHQLVAHWVGRITLGVANNGSLGSQNTPAPGVDPFTGMAVPDCEYPKLSNTQYLYSGAFWIGAVVNNGRDTLVSVGADGWQRTQEMFPGPGGIGAIVKRSITDPEEPEYANAISEEDYVAIYTDTLTEGVDQDFFGRLHMPLGIEVTQTSMAWSYSYAEDFVLFDYRIKNIGTDVLSDVYMGIYIDADVMWESDDETGSQDDICGFLRKAVDTCYNCPYEDTTVFAAWIADNDGDFDRPVGAAGTIHPTPAVTATKIIRTPAESLEVSFNWWIGNGTPSLDFGPRERDNVGRLKEKYRDFRTGGMGTPEGDLNKYYVMRNREFDYDQVYTASIQPNDSLWMYPNQNLADSFAVGYDTRYLLSFGPFFIRPGQTLPISFAYVAGDSLNTPGDYAEQYLPDFPDAYYDALDFSDLALNSKWASWVYDNPGVDTDGDFYFGEMETCPSGLVHVRTDTFPADDDHPTEWYVDIWDTTSIETCWVKGDGVPDWTGASPPPAPDFWLSSEVGKLKIRFNGLASETVEDVFSRKMDFEGYRVYMARDQRASSFSVLASFDLEDYNKHVNVNPGESPARYGLRDTPFKLRELRCLYGSGENPCDDESFNPLDYSRSSPYVHPDHVDSVFYFTKQDYNQSRLGIDTPIEKIYPNQPYPTSLIPDEAEDDEKTADGYLKYFEYKMEINDLLPSVPWYVNVTAFDYGSPQSGLASLETPVDNGAKSAFAINDAETVVALDAKVFVYPNPYRLDGNYQDMGFEGRTSAGSRSADRIRQVTFANLPSKCLISVFTIDGDLIEEIDHDVDDPPSGTLADCFSETTDCWTVITRNTQRVVSGLYYWSVEVPGGETQIGKLVIIM